MEELLQGLQKVGIPGYEAKAYLALLGAGRPLNGYEVAKVSGVPRSTVYETLTKLVRRGAAFEVRAGDQLEYVPLPAEAFLSRLQRGFDSTIHELERDLQRIAQPTDAHLIHHLSGFEAVLDRAEDLIAGAKRSIHISAWADHLASLNPSLHDAASRHVETWIHVWGGSDADDLGSYSNPLSQPGTPFDRTEWVRSRIGFQLLVVAADHEVIVTAGSSANEVWGVYTDDPAVVLLGTEAIIHYIVSDILIRTMGPDKFLAFWESDPTLMRLATGGKLKSRRAGPRRARGSEGGDHRSGA